MLLDLFHLRSCRPPLQKTLLDLFPLTSPLAAPPLASKMLLDLFHPSGANQGCCKECCWTYSADIGLSVGNGPFSFLRKCCAPREHEKCSWTYPCENCPMQGEEGKCGASRVVLSVRVPRDGLSMLRPCLLFVRGLRVLTSAFEGE